jgi:hypothetical protein
MALSSRMSRPRVLATAALFATAAVSGPAREARADEVSPTGKGIVGGGLLGAEVVTIVEGIADVRSGWAYAIGAIVGAGGGATGGYFVEQNSSDGKVPTYMLAGGLALVIPAIVLTLNGTRYRPEQGVTEDNVPRGPAAEPGAPGGGVVVPPPSAAPSGGGPGPASPLVPQSLLDVRGGEVRLGVPAVSVRPVFSLTEQRQYGTQAQTELRMPVLHVVF